MIRYDLDQCQPTGSASYGDIRTAITLENRFLFPIIVIIFNVLLKLLKSENKSRICIKKDKKENKEECTIEGSAIATIIMMLLFRNRK
jgi:hypothetical protein